MDLGANIGAHNSQMVKPNHYLAYQRVSLNKILEKYNKIRVSKLPRDFYPHFWVWILKIMWTPLSLFLIYSQINKIIMYIDYINIEIKIQELDKSFIICIKFYMLIKIEVPWNKIMHANYALVIKGFY